MSQLTTTDDASTYAESLLTGNSIRLRPLHEDDVPTLEAWWADPATAIEQQGSVRPQPAGLNRIELQVWAFNSRAIRAYTKAGFVEEGRRRDAVFHGGQFHDAVIMSILAREWHAAN